MKKKKKWIGAILFGLIAGIAFFLWTSATAHASGLLDETIDVGNEFSRYGLMNYQLDYYVDTSWDWLPWNWSRGLGNQVTEALFAITNMFWILSLLISSATGYIVQEAFNLDFVGQTAEKIGRNIQIIAGVDRTGIHGGFYGGFLLLLILIIGVYVAYTGLLKREATKAIRALLNFLIVIVLSTSFIAFAPDYITHINEFSRDMSHEALKIGTQLVLPDSSIQGENSTSLIRDSLFGVQVVEPWKILQFGSTDISSERVDNLRSVSPLTSEREDVVINEISDYSNLNLTITSTMPRLGIVFFLLLFNTAISIFVFLLTAVMIASQIIFIVFAMFLPISFLLSMIPTFENMSKKAIMNVFNTLMVRAGITLIITIAFSISTMLYSLSSDTAFFFIMFLQVVTFGGIYSMLPKIMGMFSLQAGDSQSLSKSMSRNVQRVMGRANRKMNPIRKSGVMGARANGNFSSRGNPAVNPKKIPMKNENERGNINSNEPQNQGSMGSRIGRNIGKITDTKDSILDKGREVKEEVKNLPVNAQYAIHKGKRHLGDNVSDLKDSIEATKESAQQERENKRNTKRELVAQRHLELKNNKSAGDNAISKEYPREKANANGKMDLKESPNHQKINKNQQKESKKEETKKNQLDTDSIEKNPSKNSPHHRANSNRESAETTKNNESEKKIQDKTIVQSKTKDSIPANQNDKVSKRSSSSTRKRPNVANPNSIDNYIESYDGNKKTNTRRGILVKRNKKKNIKEQSMVNHSNKENDTISTKKRR